MIDSLRAQLNKMRWTSEWDMELDGQKYLASALLGASTPDRLLVLKLKANMEAYATVLEGKAIDQILEIGIHEGGSSTMFASLFEPKKLVGIDIREPFDIFDNIRAAHRLRDRIAIHYRTSQDDEAALNAICDQEFDGPIDLIVDDASHLYPQTKRAFEITFPRLRPGGVYVIEDWRWAHDPTWTHWEEHASLMNLLTQIMMLFAARSDLIASVKVYHGAVFIEKAADAPAGEPLDLDTACRLRGRPFTLL
jgi:predicted O-methyltransferase YrrM